jgi:Ser/Thr protein kinase RdoA (MazF antagonist)
MSTTALSHAQDGSLAAPHWPPLTVEELRGLLRLYPSLEGQPQVLTVSPRPFSAASIVRVGPHQVFVKRHARSVRNASALHEEHAFMAHLRTHRASVPRVLADKRGNTAIEINDWTYEVHELPHGVDLYRDAISWTPFFHAAHAHSAGQAMARLHLAAQGYDAPARAGRPLVAGFSIFSITDPHTALQSYVSARPALSAYVQNKSWLDETMELLAPFHAELLPLLPALTPLWTHNDLHPSNLFWSDQSAHAQVASIIDFGLSDRTSAIHDLAHAIERSIVEWLALVEHPDKPAQVPIHFDHLDALLAGYESIRPFSTEERAALAPITALCHAEFALSEADYFLSVLHSEEEAHYACPAYLLDHARWWHSTGAALLNKIRTWAGVTTG